jgi:hypothetical protein
MYYSVVRSNVDRMLHSVTQLKQMLRGATGAPSKAYGGFLAQVKKGISSTWKALLGREADDYLALLGNNRSRELYRTLETIIDCSLLRVLCEYNC